MVSALGRLFRRHAGPIDATASGEVIGVPMVDTVGQAFNIVRASGADLAVWRVEGTGQLTGLRGDKLVLIAAYDAAELERLTPVIREHPSVVVGVGLGEWAGSRALMLGALAYAHTELDPSALRGQIADALARHESRRTRARSFLAVASA